MNTIAKTQTKIFSFLWLVACLNSQAGNQDSTAVANSLKQNGEWYVFSVKQSTRFKVLGKYDYDPARKGMFYKGTLFKGKFYLMNKDGVVYEPTWENKHNLKQYVAPAKQYFTKLSEKVKKYKNEFDASAKKVETAQEDVEKLKGTWIKLTRKGIVRNHYNKSDSHYTRVIREAQKEYKKAKKELEDLEDEHKKIDAKYQAANKEYKDFSALYTRLKPAASADMEPERQELITLIKELPLKEIKSLLQKLKQSEKSVGKN